MAKVNSVSDIWKEVEKGSILPHVLKIRLTDNVTKKPGCLYLFDLLHPRFLPLLGTTEKEQKIYYSFEMLSKYLKYPTMIMLASIEILIVIKNYRKAC